MRKWLWVMATLALADAALLLVLSYATARVGLLSPGGNPHLGVVALAAIFLVLRVVVRFLLPAAVVFAASKIAISRMMRRWGHD